MMRGRTMSAVVVTPEGGLRVDAAPYPVLVEPDDAIVRITTSAICGSDLHLRHGRIPGMRVGSVVGHEYVGVVEQVGPDARGLAPGDRVLGSFMVPCGTCWACLRGAFGRCPTHRILGYGQYTGDLDGAQAEAVRVPRAALSLRPLTTGAAEQLTDEQVLPVGDVLTTGYDCAAEGRITAGDVVMVQGLGPVGLFALQSALLFEPGLVIAVDPLADRRDRAARLGAVALDPGEVDIPSAVRDRTSGTGADVVLECVGALPALEQALAAVRPGGRVSVVGIYSEPTWTTALNVHFARGVELKLCGTANVVGLWESTLSLVADGTIDTSGVVSHSLPLEQADDGYARLEAGEAFKVLLTP